MKAFYLAWNRQNQSLVWNGDDWRRSKTEPEHRAQAKLIRESIARQNLTAMRCRFPALMIEVVPVVDRGDLARMADRRRR